MTGKRPRPGEFELIARYLAPLAAGTPGAFDLKDDAAVVDLPGGRQLVVTVDAMVAGVHFLPDDPPAGIGAKLLAVNLSDLAAMGAEPFGYVLTTAWPEDTDEDWIAAFVGGLRESQDRYGLHLLGGDTVGTPGPLSLSLTALGTIEQGRALTRGGARPGDRVFVSGTVGDGVLGLQALRGELAGEAKGHVDALARRYRQPEPRLALGRALLGIASAACDVSDGLFADLGHICETSGVAATVEAAKVPLSEAARAVTADDPERRECAIAGGDDYELVFTAAPDRTGEVRAAAGRAGVAVTEIGAIETADGRPRVVAIAADGRRQDTGQRGWQHF